MQGNLRLATEMISTSLHPRIKHERKNQNTSINLVEKPVNKLKPQDISACYKLVRNIRWLYISANEGWKPEHKLREMKETEGLQYLIFYENNTIIAFANFVMSDELYGLDFPLTFLWEIHVHPKYRRHGLGKRLITKILEKADQQGEAVALRCFNSNDKARQFYEKMGFVVADVVCDANSRYLIKYPSKRC